jgi:hypothetical protein
MREIKVYSMSALDLLTCALGGTILVSFLLIVSITQSGKAGFEYSYFAISAGVWIDITEQAKVKPGKEELNRLLAAENFPQEALKESWDRFRGEFEVELEVYRKRDDSSNFGSESRRQGPRRSDHSVPRDVAKPAFRVNLAESGLQRNSQSNEANLIKRSESLGLRRVTHGRDSRLYAAYRVDVAGFKVEPGWYFVRPSIVKHTPGGISPINAAAWLRIHSSGWPRAARFQTHDTFDDTEWPDGGGYQGIKNELRVDGQRSLFRTHPEKTRETMQKLGWPDLYIPDWPADYPIPGDHIIGRFELRAGSEDWPRFFALRRERNASSATTTAARLPEPGKDPIHSPGWHQSEPSHAKDGEKVWDDYLPGFRIEKSIQL